MTALSVGIEPVQSGSGTPSPDNIRPISGRTQCDVFAEDEYDALADPKITIDLNGTIYGGTLNVLTGTMVVDRAFAELTNVSQLSSYTTSAQYGSYATFASGAVKNQDSQISVISSMMRGISYSNRVSGAYVNSDRCYVDTAGYVLVRASALVSITSVNDLFSRLSGAQLVYKLATPLTVQLSANTLSTLLGNNNIWASTGQTNVTYRADTKLFIEQLTKPTEDDMVANTNISSGKYFMVGNRLFKSTASIASGEAIVPETNCTAMSLADALNQLA